MFPLSKDTLLVPVWLYRLSPESTAAGCPGVCATWGLCQLSKYIVAVGLAVSFLALDCFASLVTLLTGKDALALSTGKDPLELFCAAKALCCLGAALQLSLSSLHGPLLLSASSLWSKVPA